MNSLRGPCLLLVILTAATAACSGSSQSVEVKNKKLADIIGSTHVAGNYYLTDKDYLNEGADQILAMGSRVIKIWFCGKRHETQQVMYPYNSKWPEINSLAQGAQAPYMQALFKKPFTTYIMVVTSLGRADGYWRTRITDADQADEQKQFYELAKYLLTAYRGTGKTFILAHWEGDWMVRGHFDFSRAPEPSALKNMILWLNARQAGVNQARKEVGEQGVHVFHAAEVNRVVITMRQGQHNMVDSVLPYINVDLVSYSAWDASAETGGDPNVIEAALDFIAAKVPDSTAFGNKNVYIGEYGLPENLNSPEKLRAVITNTVQTGLKWGCPYIVYWQLYCNELQPIEEKPPVYPTESIERPVVTAKPAVHDNKAVRGYWLFRPDGTKTWAYDYLHNLLAQ